jgi:uncharacterized protein (DUF433 family)
MEQVQFSDYPNIVSDTDYCDGQPRVKNTRITVTALLSYIAGGMSVEELLKEFPKLSKEDVYQALAFASAQLQARYIPLKRNVQYEVSF